MLLALILVALFSQALYNSVGTIPSRGVGEVVTDPATSPRSAMLTLKKAQPAPVVAGTGFKSREVVRFIGVSAKPIRASASGTFVVRLRRGDPCGLSITAIGSKGSRATLSYAQLLCAEP
ncbi:MAG TPA: hypothetical protein VFM13_03885 [Gaiellaceae bacterium]|nr:hypothetical protein [Gaiellaceae bacterium]